ncbi:MAG: Gx transporter family protein [Ruminococcaceae bacterium]|nr:Gx transporter family protein [Oscillospiraceae bacterium]
MPLSTKPTVRRVAVSAMFVAAALIVSWLERPLMAALPLPIPGFKLGLANVIVLFALYRFGIANALTVQFLRLALGALLFGSPISALLSISGGTLAVLVSCVVFRLPHVSPVGTSILAAAMHMVGQIAAAAIVLAEPLLFTAYLPYLLLLSVVSGGICGVVAQILLTRLPC